MEKRNLLQREERSSGGAVYRYQKPLPRRQAGHIKVQKDDICWLLGKHSGYHKWVLPKGLIEQGESEQQTAVREVEEEMGVVARIVGDEPIHEDEYWFEADYSENSINSGGPERRVLAYQEGGGKQTSVHKRVVFYLMEYITGDVKNHSWEMEDAGWFSFEEAMKLLDFEGERTALKKASTKLF